MPGSYHVASLGRNEFENLVIALAGATSALILWLISRFTKKTENAQDDRDRSYWFSRFRFRQKVYHRHDCKYAPRIGLGIGRLQSQPVLFDRGYRPCMTCMPDRYPYVKGEWVPTNKDWLKSNSTRLIPAGPESSPMRPTILAWEQADIPPVGSAFPVSSADPTGSRHSSRHSRPDRIRA
jgi:hypothetical protein